mgnify:CR=1 FL=1
MSSLAIIVIIVLLAAFIYMWAKCQSLQKEVHSKENKENELKKLALVLQNINAYFLLIDKDFVVCDTNYYSLNRLPIQVGGVTKRVGDEQCKLCCIRASIGKAFYKKASFKNLEASMKLLSEDETKVTLCDVSVSGTYLNIHGEDYMVLTVYDVTELKNVQRLLSIEREHSISADKLKSAFIANMSHEVRTPLNAIVGFSGLMVSASSEEERKMYADVIAENNERLLRLVNDIFDLSQIESGTVDFVYTEFDANDLLRELEGIFKTKLNNSSVELVCEAHIQPIMMYSERERIIQVLSNLLHNAMKFTESGEIRLGCSLKGTEEVCFVVSDTGIGIPKEEQKKIFSRFIKLDREMQGTGLGLTLSQTIIQNLGGNLELDSEINRGSTFSFVLPRVIKPELIKSQAIK